MTVGGWSLDRAHRASPAPTAEPRYCLTVSLSHCFPKATPWGRTMPYANGILLEEMPASQAAIRGDSALVSHRGGEPAHLHTQRPSCGGRRSIKPRQQNGVCSPEGTVRHALDSLLGFAIMPPEILEGFYE
jgi:hypothetical protein